MRKSPALLGTLISLLALAACSFVQPYSPQATRTPTAEPTPLPVLLPEGQQGFFLVRGDGLLPLPRQILSETQSLYLADVPAADEGQPQVLARLAGLQPAQLKLWQVRGSVGVLIALDNAAGGVRVRAVRPGFGAETGGLQAGDLILSVDGQPLKDFIANIGGEDRFAELLTGPLGTQVPLVVQRGSQQLNLQLLRNFPTLLSIYRPLDFKQQAGAGGALALTPGGTLPQGLYCYEPSHFTFYCFTVGMSEVAQPMPSIEAPRASPTPAQTEGALGFHPAPCRFVVEAGLDVTCGFLVVQEDRSQPQGKTVRLHVAVFHNPYRTQPDPVIYLHGGPGGGALEWASNAFPWFKILFPGRDLVVFDQRGTGFSQPRLACTIANDYAASLAQDERLSEIAWEAARMPACLQDLEAQGIDLSAYTTLASAADLHDLIRALGYDKVNLFGQSYGTNLALTYLDEYGDQGKLRSLILDGVAPPEADLFAERGLNAQGAFKAIFDACASDPACSQAFPDAEQHFYRLLERLAANPVALTAEDTGNVPVVVNDHRLIEALYRDAYFSDRVWKIPAMLAGFERGDYRLFRQALDDMLASAMSVDSGVYFAVRCSDQSRLPPAETPLEQLEPALQDYFLVTEQAMRKLCASSPFASGEQEKVRPFTSETPVLLLSGAFDPATPPAWAETVAARLPDAYHYISPTGSHDQLMGDTCAQAITTRFIQDLAPPDDPCLQQGPKPYFFTGGGN